MNVSLPTEQQLFVRSQVAAGRYRTASEVVREGLRLLQDAEHRRLVEKWLYEDLSDEELGGLPEELKVRVRDHVRGLIEEAVEDVKAGRVTDGPSALEGLRAELQPQGG